MDVLIEDDLIENARARGEQLMTGARQLASKYPGVVREVRGMGLLAGVGLALRLGVPAVTADRAWLRLKIGVRVEAIR